MKSVREATYDAWTYESISGEERVITASLFTGEEVERAEMIVKSMEGLTIESAQSLLKKVNKYLLETRKV